MKLENANEDASLDTFVCKYLYIDRNGELLESRSYDTLVNGQKATWYYGSPKVDPNKDYVCILDIDGIRRYLEYYGPEFIKLIYVNTDDDTRENRAKARGSFDKTEWDRRSADDSLKFSEEEIKRLRNDYGQPITVIDNNGDTPRFSVI